MNVSELQQYMNRRIPLSVAMQATVVEANADAVTLRAPLAPNINHRDTVFGGSASAVALLAGWALLFLRLRDRGLDGGIVVRRNTMSYERPITEDFTATAAIANPAAWEEFADHFRRKGRARIHITVILESHGEQVGQLEGEFVVAAPRE